MASQYATFCLPLFSGSDEEAALNLFLRSHRIIQVVKQFVPTRDPPSWSLLVEYLDTPHPGSSPKQHSEQAVVDYKDLLSEPDFALFRRLRDLRKSVAESDGVPVYAVFTNRELADMARGKPASVVDLKKIGGIGEGKSERYGERFLLAIAEAPDEKDRVPF